MQKEADFGWLGASSARVTLIALKWTVPLSALGLGFRVQSSGLDSALRGCTAFYSWARDSVVLVRYGALLLLLLGP